MTSVTPLRATDLLYNNHVNLDILTEVFYSNFYFEYLARWPTLCFKTSSPAPDVGARDVCTGYMLGKVEGAGHDWHSHITAVTVAWDYRCMGLAKYLVRELVDRSDNPLNNCYFMDLFVRASNRLAINLYKNLGFDVFRRIRGYYSSTTEPSEDAFGEYNNNNNKNQLDYG
ncbi:uncharacterized protein SAPINGB_P001164 [Magnusiomyces paraingens]|uniref:N-acetyltransferase domain-containing protein n=1 Tax=Magnusiomyces paraingens TaxID=2606893 RepID=A0A5E8B4C5_9ASCO|nr:uncharacterized protein SAPINGB_P001164 [Saprochaete ingens]VVT46339.1 unnamed protein product [Saprochaete ingens]